MNEVFEFDIGQVDACKEGIAGKHRRKRTQVTRPVWNIKWRIEIACLKIRSELDDVTKGESACEQ